MRPIDDKYSVDGEKIIKMSTGEEVPDGEPLIIFRGRDRLALPMLQHYRELCYKDGATDYQLESMDKMIGRFEKFAQENNTKQPGITEGRPWDGSQS